MQIADLFANVPADLPAELFETLLETESLRIERIVSHAHASEPDFWYDQDEHEWVLLLQGAARLELEGESEPIELRAGQAILLPAHQRHRVAWTTAEESTIWLAVFYR
ncbi:cupin domain-containing protein [Blastopirellula sp. JC732]|uniref:Cupin domain-containing protein n=1 Tax=Blastopirellula sediminis TaxID=2894196 RepID=A0A9X1MSP6_9BACT|nr:cupin domain-containing protein [Blastopirellula sediminis]MCC9605313.1 cupin domain-containing protein [Blastopirellula sediminis]MCC9631387.1 cupin domain-containing protein [Blastopirellula sediminis]